MPIKGMGQTQDDSWSESEQKRFLTWLKPNKKDTVHFLHYPRISLAIASETDATSYRVKFSGADYKLDALDHLAPLANDSHHMEYADYDAPSAPNAEDYGSAFANFSTPIQFEEMLADFVADYVVPGRESNAKKALEFLFFSHSASQNVHLFQLIISDVNPALSFWSLMLHYNIPPAVGKTTSDVAKICGVTKAAVSKRMKQLEKKYGAITRAAKSTRARAAYSDVRKLKQ
jgi:hypothetical protein